MQATTFSGFRKCALHQTFGLYNFSEQELRGFEEPK
jgi:hypothetical protein